MNEKNNVDPPASGARDWPDTDGDMESDIGQMGPVTSVLDYNIREMGAVNGRIGEMTKVPEVIASFAALRQARRRLKRSPPKGGPDKMKKAGRVKARHTSLPTQY
jgi:hypothetical protein